MGDAEHDQIEPVPWFDGFPEPDRDGVVDLPTERCAARVDEVDPDVIAVFRGAARADVELDVVSGSLQRLRDADVLPSVQQRARGDCHRGHVAA